MYGMQIGAITRTEKLLEVNKHDFILREIFLKLMWISFAKILFTTLKEMSLCMPNIECKT